MFSVSVESYVRCIRTYSVYRAFFVRGESLQRIVHIDATPGAITFRAETLRQMGSHVTPQEVELAGTDLIILKEGGEA